MILNIYNNVFTNGFDKNHKPIFINDICIYNDIKINYIGNREFLYVNRTDNVKHNLNELYPNIDSVNLVNSDADKYGYYILLVFDKNTNNVAGIIDISESFNMIYMIYEDLEYNKEILDKLSINKIFIDKKIYKINKV